MTAAEFDGLSLADLHEMNRAFEQRTRREDYRSGLLAMLLVAMFGGRSGPPPELADWFPSFEGVRRPEITPEQMEAKLEAIFGTMGAKPKE